MALAAIHVEKNSVRSTLMKRFIQSGDSGWRIISITCYIYGVCPDISSAANLIFCITQQLIRCLKWGSRLNFTDEDVIFSLSSSKFNLHLSFWPFLPFQRSCSSLHSLFKAQKRLKNKGKSWISYKFRRLRCFHIESMFSGASVSFVLSHIARHVPSHEENSCIPITHFQCKTHFEHLLIAIKRRKFAGFSVPSQTYDHKEAESALLQELKHRHGKGIRLYLRNHAEWIGHANKQGLEG